VLAGPPPADDKTPRPPPPPARIFGSRDLVIIIDCLADGVVVHPGGQSFSLATLPARAESDHALPHAVRQLIARRQSLLRDGEAPLQPTLRFQIRPDGLRAYYRAFPLLEQLRLPMTRENVE
jgi:hypothetical protein